MSFRYLLVLGLIFYVLYKIGKFFFKAGAASQQLRQYERMQQQADAARKADKKRSRKIGEYVDYEEIK
ncbi:hypothetical protein [Pseudochryseolinea flava]|uniref:DUF4834 domain-containing protein n=1 Tax=Pseudochryseolinea flava TaxID=2059302 RepID=A0A364YCF5_9BACT|nr:hypothetical protein [Pseudochryseolinea flava]RAW03388.1 hypothetical protein DQQ10_04695 [Pseudochryseolinea flava]